MDVLLLLIFCSLLTMNKLHLTALNVKSSFFLHSLHIDLFNKSTIPKFFQILTTPIPGKSVNVTFPLITSIPLNRSLEINKLPSKSAKSTRGES